MIPRASYLGDGAYLTFDDYGGVVLTANHHRPAEATDTVYLDRHAVESMLAILGVEQAKENLA